MGMWLFLFTELMLFMGMFLLYAVYRYIYSQDFQTASQELSRMIGTVNTLILITSSFTMAISASAIERADKKLSICFLSATILMGLIFIINKYMEWSDKINHGIYPGSARLLNSKGETVFYGLYYAMTGMHGLHMAIGILLLSTMLISLIMGKLSEKNFVSLENSGLYWHLVDIIWIFLFPLFYLI